MTTDKPVPTAATILAAIHVALRMGARISARELAQEGARLHPDSVELDRLNRILHLPKVTLKELAK